MQFWWLGVIAAVVLWDFVSGDSYRASVVLYDNSSCSPPASVVSFPNAYCSSPQADHYAPVCQDNDVSYSVTDCDWYYIGGYDYYGIIQQAFGDSVPYLIVEEYFQVDWGWGGCTTGWWSGDYGLGDVTAYRLDEDCHSNDWSHETYT
ncbi:hypothetical protein PF005_g13922 [Phytophthora fragariae]|uniref:Uncharacterized protein n=1 Tax=Phytophthora fragariae TaxID=53985 RepID=A0A6A3RKF6_9STRA|nr:hypothetical protein PF003_g8916 [Phytophthora fragariae]KAE8933021.1 hypothetical protein PF009_g16964 [Phytophthora fragariae]KAE9000396.1 hypothetical protein PF011_g14199 [Phytophthora fragariae]KAE9099120.1 hypothetical protein PF007_g15998 [Phytophthora fragariae]KAE9102857.1 hypothetical protein PF010_g13961 [Phytophthora fragariae]